jgi:hypothetical protein
MKTVAFCVAATLLAAAAPPHNAPATHADDAPRIADVAPAAPSPALHENQEALERERLLVVDATEALAEANGKLTWLAFGFLIIGAIQVGMIVVQILVLFRSIPSVEAAVSTRNRPRLVLRHCDLETFEPGRLAKVLWIVENMGNSPATILEAHATLLAMRRGTLPAIPEYDQRNHATGGMPVDVGRGVRLVQFTGEELSSGDYDAVTRLGTGVVLFYGYLLYEDALKIRRRTGFCRLFDSHTGRFTVLDDPNYEYAD